MAYNHLYSDTLGIEHGFLLTHTFDQLSDCTAITDHHEPPLIQNDDWPILIPVKINAK